MKKDGDGVMFIFFQSEMHELREDMEREQLEQNTTYKNPDFSTQYT